MKALPQGDLALAEILGDQGVDLSDQPEFIDHSRHQAKVVEVGAGIGRDNRYVGAVRVQCASSDPVEMRIF